MSPPFPIPVTNFATSAASPSIITAGLELHLDAGNVASYPGTGTSWLDLTANNYDFTFVGAPSYTATPGYFNFGYGGVAANRATNTDTIAITTGAFEMWFRWRAGSALAATIIAAYPSSWVSLGNATGTYPDEAWECNFASSPTMDYQNSHTLFRDGEWYHIVAVIDGISNQLYVDGAPVATSFRNGSAVSTGLWAGAASAIGNQYGGGGYQFDSDIAIMRLYDAATFSAADVLNNYTVEQARFKTFWPDSLDSLTLWIDPSAAETVTLAGSNITYINDQARVLTDAYFQPDALASKQPTLVSSGGINWMDFNMANVQWLKGLKNSGASNLNFNDIFGTNTWEMHLVLRPDAATAANANPYDNHGIIGETGGYGFFYLKDTGATVTVQSYMYDSGVSVTDYPITPGDKHIFGQSKTAGTTDFNSYKDGALTALAGVGNLSGGAANQVWLGSAYGGNTYDGLIGEVCVFNAPLTSGERTSLIAYLKAKWGTP